MKLDRTRNLVKAAKRFLRAHRDHCLRDWESDAFGSRKKSLDIAEDTLVKALRPFTTVTPRRTK